MTSVRECFQSLRAKNQCALIPFLTAGDPDLATTAKALHILEANGADLIELGVPYSDPLADGPVIQAAATRALKNGVRLEDVLNIVQQARPQLKAPIILFTYYNPIFARGKEAFLSQIATAGVQGLVVPDLPLEEAEQLIEPAKKYGIEVILLVTPNTPPDRIKAIASQSQGFIYLVSVTGVTGMRTNVATKVQDLISTLRNTTDKPIGVGFGISDPQQAQQMQQWGTDAVIVGSACVKILASGTAEDALGELGEFCHSLKKAISTNP